VARLSPNFLITNKNGRIIHSLDEWRVYAPPVKKDAQWQENRSALELANSWICKEDYKLPNEIKELFEKEEAIASVVLERGVAESSIKVPCCSSKPCVDLLLFGNIIDNITCKPIVVGIEAKADESFGASRIGKYYNKMKSGNPRSSIPDFIEVLCSSLLGRKLNASLEKIRYQLLTDLAGTLVVANNTLPPAWLVMFIAHVFVSNCCNDKKLLNNNNDWRFFLEKLPKHEFKSGKDWQCCIPGDIVQIGYFVLYTL
jgi:hypothetical protein